MLRPARLALLVVVLVGCAPSGDRADSTAAMATPARPDARAGAATAVAIPDSTCTAVASLVAGALQVRLDRDPATTFAAPGDDGSWSGCRFTAQLSAPSGESRTPAMRIAEALRAAGWTTDDRWLADGAADTEEGWVRGDALCHLAYVTPVGDVEPDAPAHAAPPPSLQYDIELRCTSPVPPRPS